MQGTLRIHQLEIECIIGCLPEERELEQTLFVDLECDLEWSTHPNDKLSHTVDYVELARVCTQVATEGKFQLIESLAFHMLKEVLKAFPLKKARVRVRKPGALPQARCTEFELEQTSEEGMLV